MENSMACVDCTKTENIAKYRMVPDYDTGKVSLQFTLCNVNGIKEAFDYMAQYVKETKKRELGDKGDCGIYNWAEEKLAEIRQKKESEKAELMKP